MKRILSLFLILAMMCCCSCADNGSESNGGSSLDLSSLEVSMPFMTSSQDIFSNISQTDSETSLPPTHTLESATKAATHIFLAVCEDYHGLTNTSPGYEEYTFYPIEKYGSDKGDLPKRSGQIETGEYRNEGIKVMVPTNRVRCYTSTYSPGNMCVLWLKYNEEKNWYEDIYPEQCIQKYELETQEELDARAEEFSRKKWQIADDIREILSKGK